MNSFDLREIDSLFSEPKQLWSVEKDTGTDQILRLKIQDKHSNNIQSFLSFVRMETGAWGMEDEAWLEAWGIGHRAESVGHSMNIGYEHGA